MITEAISFDRPGDPDVLIWRPTDLPEPGPGDVVVDVYAAGVNNADLLQRQGQYPVPPDAPATLGLECSGRLSWVGPQVEGWAVGDAVCALLIGGGYAEQVVVPAAQLLPKPQSLTFIEAAALPEALCTVYANLAMTAHVRRGSSLLVHGGGSGIGTTAIQWGKAVGARVLTTVGSDWKRDRVLGLGADVAVNYRDEDFATATLRATAGRGVDAILDIVGAPYLRANVDCLAPGGHLVIIGGRVDGSGRLELGTLMAKRASVSATMLRPRPKAEKAAVVGGVRREAWPLVDAGLIVPIIDTVLPIRQAARAHELLTAGRTFGKVVLAVDVP
ncbi:NAD(P)H-quinone oxidoreductase [Actinoplanes sp. OR16]|uniref:NAD(P)H-quinone oxidoreductase n=1 Tax=Actinoplanes sp. OR16 TaxID=946334 RepID=UPI000FDBCB07|nr:NAD(P)H-quinone oxidoreductase [Actinoplanes sp. OR16]